jgi:polyisoprenoid-binding protein YceI
MRRRAPEGDAVGMTAHDEPAPEPGIYRIDPGRSVITFHTRHLFGLGPVRGTLRFRAGEINVAGAPQASVVRAVADAASFHTGNPARDRTVRSARLINTGRYPDITFTSSRLTGEPSGQWTLHGLLSAAGNEHPVRVLIDRARSAGPELSVQAAAAIDRYDFGVTAFKGLAGRHLSCRIEIVAHREER